MKHTYWKEVLVLLVLAWVGCRLVLNKPVIDLSFIKLPEVTYVEVSR